MHPATRGNNISRSNPIPVAPNIDATHTLSTDLGSGFDGQARQSLWSPRVRYPAPHLNVLFKNKKHHQPDPDSSGSNRGSTKTQRIIHKFRDITKPASKLMHPRGLRYPVIQPVTSHPLGPQPALIPHDLGPLHLPARESFQEPFVWNHISDKQRVLTAERAAAAKIYLETYYREALSEGPTPREARLTRFQFDMDQQASYLEQWEREERWIVFLKTETDFLREQRNAKAHSCRVA
ncbi:hypothetical protein CTA2_6953 [Colletotrichum tanaceti]|uniref:Uncharacterized protein n=1 Tax=Colletotrichum tanaceti TaxID=1306861 RepID=A0A4U6XVY0_9PEZI|nr:hypothetical protein CTA2_6953 [Colletotrichum tanaceti]TKW60253.1 hypothetical protein CTA1_4914 [Colletotrichum tanaceti]